MQPRISVVPPLPLQSSVVPTARKPVALNTGKIPVGATQLGHVREALPMPFILQAPEEQTDNWDDDFEEGISLTKLQGSHGVIIYSQGCLTNGYSTGEDVR